MQTGRQSSVHGAVWWSELMTRDTEQAMAYYHDVCGWEFDHMPMGEGTYHVAKHGGQPVAGIMDMRTVPDLDGVPAHWFTYLAVDNVARAVEQTADAGGEVRRAPFDVPGVGSIAIVADPGGAAFGLMTPADPGGG